MLQTAIQSAFALIACYFATTFALWLGHWLSHLEWSPFRIFHVLGHHRLYPNGGKLRTRKFIYSKGIHDSNYALAPWLILVIMGEFVVLPLWLALICFVQSAILIGLFSVIHLQFHLESPFCRRFLWFQRARSRHNLHHFEDVNFMVVDHFWDRVFRTWRPEH